MLTPSVTEAASASSLRRRSWSSLADLAYESIVEAIFEGHFPPDAPLTIDALARDLRMSNSPLREALTRLTAERLVVFSANRGYSVAPRLTEAGYHDLFDVRFLLEIHALEGADVDPAVADLLAQILDRMEAVDHGPAYRAYKTFNQADRSFHRALVGMSSNEFLLRAWTDLHFHLHVGRLYSGAGIIDHDEGGQEHRAIIDAVRAGDKAELIRRDALHIQRAERRLAPLLAPSGRPPPAVAATEAPGEDRRGAARAGSPARRRSIGEGREARPRAPRRAGNDPPIPEHGVEPVPETGDDGAPVERRIR